MHRYRSIPISPGQRQTAPRERRGGADERRSGRAAPGKQRRRTDPPPGESQDIVGGRPGAHTCIHLFSDRRRHDVRLATKKPYR